MRLARASGPCCPSGRSGVAEAMITGERGTIPQDVNDSLQTSGLAHILSISGLHMSLVAGAVLLAGACACWPLSSTLAVALSDKKMGGIGRPG